MPGPYQPFGTKPSDGSKGYSVTLNCGLCKAEGSGIRYQPVGQFSFTSLPANWRPVTNIDPNVGPPEMLVCSDNCLKRSDMINRAVQVRASAKARKR